MYWLLNDYQDGCHPAILNRLREENAVIQSGYGEDEYTLEAVRLIKASLNSTSSDVHLLSAGTQANMICAAAFLRPHHSIIACESGHINIHECGAIESLGHKINTINSADGKITSEQIIQILQFHSNEHLVKPKMVYISNSTELGTVYTLNEIENLRKFTRLNSLYLYMDGARIGSALASEKSNLRLDHLTKLVDAFYIGGTKNGALLGEAVVINNDQLKEDFRFFLKQKGALLAKGRILGIQFSELFKNNLFLEIAGQANLQAKKLAQAIFSKGYKFYCEPESNQIFPILPVELVEKLEKKFKFYRWNQLSDKEIVVRLVTSWVTNDEAIDAFIGSI